MLDKTVVPISFSIVAGAIFWAAHMDTVVQALAKDNEKIKSDIEHIQEIKTDIAVIKITVKDIKDSMDAAK